LMAALQASLLVSLLLAVDRLGTSELRALD